MHPSRRSDCEDPVTPATRHTFRPIPHAAARRSSAARPRAGSHGVRSPASGAETRRMPPYGRRGIRRSLTHAELPCPARSPKRDGPSPIREPEPFAAGSLNRHVAATRERFPHQHVPRGADRDVDGPLEGEPWREGRSRLPAPSPRSGHRPSGGPTRRPDGRPPTRSSARPPGSPTPRGRPVGDSEGSGVRGRSGAPDRHGIRAAAQGGRHDRRARRAALLPAGSRRFTELRRPATPIPAGALG